MAQNITLLGASYSDVPAVQLPKTGGGLAQFDDTSDADATAADILTGKTAYVNGQKLAGTGKGGWTKIAEKTVDVTTDSTEVVDVETWYTEHSEIFTKDKFVYIRIRDTAGKRDGYYYGTDQFMFKNVSSSSTSIRFMLGEYYNDDGSFASFTSGYGIFAYTIYSNGRIRIRARCNENLQFIIDGTYKIEVYLLDTIDGLPIWE